MLLKYKIEPKTNFWEFAEANLDRRFSGSFAYVCPYDTFIRVQYQHVVARIKLSFVFLQMRLTLGEKFRFQIPYLCNFRYSLV